MPPKRSVLKPYLCGVSPLKCPTSSLRHSSRLSQLLSLSPILSVHLRQSRSCLLGRIKCLPLLPSFSKDSWGAVGAGVPRYLLCANSTGRALGPQRVPGTLGPRSICRGNSKLQAIIWRDAVCTVLHRTDSYTRLRKKSPFCSRGVRRGCFLTGKEVGRGPHPGAPSMGRALLRISQSVLKLRREALP